MGKEKLIVILTSDGHVESCFAPKHASSEDIEEILSETYSLNNIEWMEIRKMQPKILKIFNKMFGLKTAN